MAPIHHHFELWMGAIQSHRAFLDRALVFALFALTTLKCAEDLQGWTSAAPQTLS